MLRKEIPVLCAAASKEPCPCLCTFLLVPYFRVIPFSDKYEKSLKFLENIFWVAEYGHFFLQKSILSKIL